MEIFGWPHFQSRSIHHLEVEHRLERHVVVVVDEVTLDDVVVTSVLLADGAVHRVVGVKTEHEGEMESAELRPVRPRSVNHCVSAIIKQQI